MGRQFTEEDKALLRRFWLHLHPKEWLRPSLDDWTIDRFYRKEYEALGGIPEDELTTWAWQGATYLLDGFELPQEPTCPDLVRALDKQFDEWDEEVEGTDEEPCGDRREWATCRRWLEAGDFAHWLLGNHVETAVVDALRENVLGLFWRPSDGPDLKRIAHEKWEQFMKAWEAMDKAEHEEKAA